MFLCVPCRCVHTDCAANGADVGRYADTRALPQGLLNALLPGPVTLVLPRLSDAALSPSVTPGLETVAVRVPGADENAVWKRPRYLSQRLPPRDASERMIVLDGLSADAPRWAQR